MQSKFFQTILTIVMTLFLASAMALAGSDGEGKKKGPPRGERSERGERGSKRQQRNGEERKSKRAPGGEGERAKGGRPGGPPSFAKLLERFDANDNGAIESEEAPGRMKERFELLDSDDSGSVDEAELQAAMEKLRARRAAGEGSERRMRGDRPDGERPERARNGKGNGKRRGGKKGKSKGKRPRPEKEVDDA